MKLFKIMNIIICILLFSNNIYFNLSAYDESEIDIGDELIKLIKNKEIGNSKIFDSIVNINLVYPYCIFISEGEKLNVFDFEKNKYDNLNDISINDNEKYIFDSFYEEKIGDFYYYITNDEKEIRKTASPDEEGELIYAADENMLLKYFKVNDKNDLCFFYVKINPFISGTGIIFNKDNAVIYIDEYVIAEMFSDKLILYYSLSEDAYDIKKLKEYPSIKILNLKTKKIEELDTKEKINIDTDIMTFSQNGKFYFNTTNYYKETGSNENYFSLNIYNLDDKNLLYSSKFNPEKYNEFNDYIIKLKPVYISNDGKNATFFFTMISFKKPSISGVFFINITEKQKENPQTSDSLIYYQLIPFSIIIEICCIARLLLFRYVP